MTDSFGEVFYTSLVRSRGVSVFMTSHVAQVIDAHFINGELIASSPVGRGL